jgi:hypothetical protein
MILVATYTDVGLLIANTNPIIADSSGRFVAFLTQGLSYKFVYTTAASVVVTGTVAQRATHCCTGEHCERSL